MFKVQYRSLADGKYYSFDKDWQCSAKSVASVPISELFAPLTTLLALRCQPCDEDSLSYNL